MMNLPGGTVTFLFTDIEGSTRLWEREPQAMQAAVARHDALLAAAVEEHTGNVVKTTGDGMLAVFGSAPQAARAALAIQRALRDEAWDAAIGQLRVRAALHTGTAELREGDYFGTAVNRAARLLSGRPRRADAAFLVDAGAATRSPARRGDVALPGRIPAQGPVAPGARLPARRSRSAGRFPTRSGHAALRPTNLPPQPTVFVGRERELAELERLLGDADVRLVTIVGPGGMGKTRLAIAAAERLLPEPGAAGDPPYPDGVFFVPLAALASADHIVGAAAEALWTFALSPAGKRASDVARRCINYWISSTASAFYSSSIISSICSTGLIWQAKCCMVRPG